MLISKYKPNICQILFTGLTIVTNGSNELFQRNLPIDKTNNITITEHNASLA